MKSGNSLRTVESIEDIVAALVAAGDGVSVSYDDEAGELTVDGRPAEEIEDIIGNALGRGLSYDDAAGIIEETRTGPNPYEAAQTFAESGVSIKADLIETSNGSLQLVDGEVAGSTADRGPDDRSASTPQRNGLIISPNTDLSGVKVGLSSNTTGFSSGYLIQHSDGTILDSVDIGSLSSGDEFDLSANLTSGSDYRVVIDNQGDNYTQGEDTDPSYPYSSEDLDITAGVTDGTQLSSEGYNVREITALKTVTATSGSVIIEWDTGVPTDIYEWDVATFTRSLDGETVDVFVGVDDGTGWTRANNGDPISRNYSLAEDPDISPSDNVRIEAELSRNDTSNNPTLDSAYRSWRV